MGSQTISAKDGQLDWLGILCSLGCAVHCAAMPILVALLPSITSIQWLADPLFHQAVAVICGLLVLRAIFPDYRRHRSGRVVAMASTGMSLLFTAAFILPDTCCSGLPRPSVSTSGLQVQKIVAVSSPSPARLGYVHAQPARRMAARDAGARPPESAPGNCAVGTCSHTPTFSRPLLTALELKSQLGAHSALTLLAVQPYLSPLGGVFLIIAHVLNIRLRCCRRSPCRGAS